MSAGVGAWVSSLLGLQGGGGGGDEKEVEVTPTSPPLSHLIPFHCTLVGEFLIALLAWK